jgi:hypothetical protein
MRIKDLIEDLQRFDKETKLDFVIYSGNEDTDQDDISIRYIGEIDTSLIDHDNPRLTIGFELNR